MTVPLEEVTDLTAFDWVAEGLRSPMGEPVPGDPGGRTVDFVPAGFPAYAKIFHRILEDPEAAEDDRTWNDVDRDEGPAVENPRIAKLLEGSTLVRMGGDDPERYTRRVLWADLVADLGLTYGRSLSGGDLDRAWPGRSWPARLLGPAEGDLTPDLLEPILRAVETEGPCFFWWWFLACQNVFDADYTHDRLFRGVLRDLPRFLAHYDVPSPTYWWPESRAWCVATDWDSCFTVIGGSDALVSRVLAADGIEGVPVGPDDVLQVFP